MGWEFSVSIDIGKVNWRDESQVAEVMRLWLESPRRQCEMSQPEAYFDGEAKWLACPNPTVGSHLFQPGHMFTDDGFCWIPGDAT